MPAKVNIYRVEMYHVASPGMSAPYWKIMHDVLNAEKAKNYADELSRFHKASSRVVHILDKEMRVIYNTSPESEAMEYFETIEGRAKDIMFQEYLENCDHQYDDLPFMRAFEFQNMLDTADGKVALYDLVVKMRKGLH